MVMATAVRERIEDARRNWPRMEEVEDRLRTAKRALVDARHASEDAVAEATLKIRRRPLAALGVLIGSLCGLAAGFVAARSRGVRS
jgi:hypothetical protein